MNQRPNILFFMADDHRHDAIGTFGDPTVQTPILDALAARGVAFRGTHIMGGSSGAVCVPTRAALHSGCNVFRASEHTENPYRTTTTINPDLALLGATLQEAGYDTFGTGKWHNDKASFARSFASGANIFFGGMSDHDQVPTHDFDPGGLYPDERRYIADGFSTELFADAAIDFLQTYDDKNPFFVYMALTSPHDPRTPPGSYATMYNPDEIPLPPNFMEEHSFDNGDMRLRDEVLAPFPRTPEIVQQHIADYYGMISHHDHHLGRVIEALREKGELENTIIVYTADHGLSVGQHGLLGKQNMYDHSIRIPHIMVGPGLPQGREIHALSYQMDIFPTLCDLIGISIPDTVEGVSLMPLLSGEQESIRNNVYSLYREVQRAVSDGEWKLIRYYEAQDMHGQAVGTDRIQLFDLTQDPWELNDLSGDPAQGDRITAMNQVLNDWQKLVNDPLHGRI
ncbi:sulfatase-like hydrolase/transferase [Chloroflexi bacterium TSY]|nr:sulfatase-like hydrolase/transferase [Chloroflexi bacterium TSY]